VPAEVAPPLTLTVGKSTVMRLTGPIERISIGATRRCWT
jgi:hypothetical protein